MEQLLVVLGAAETASLVLYAGSRRFKVSTATRRGLWLCFVGLPICFYFLVLIVRLALTQH